MAGKYKCGNCGLSFLLGSDHLEDPHGDIAWLNYVYCSQCGTNLRILCANTGYTVQSLKSPGFQSEENEQAWIELFFSGERPDLRETQCKNCKGNGTIREDLVNDICPHCHMDSIELEYFEMT